MTAQNIALAWLACSIGIAFAVSKNARWKNSFEFLLVMFIVALGPITLVLMFCMAIYMVYEKRMGR